MAKFSNTQLIQFLIKAARRINRRLCLKDTADEIVIDVTTGDFISPDDDNLRDLTLMQAECLIIQREAQESINSGTDGIRVIDGEQALDTRASAIARGTFFNSPNNPCSELEAQLKLEKINRLMSGSGGGRLVY